MNFFQKGNVRLLPVPASSRVNPLLQSDINRCRSGFTREEAGAV
ncbi:hypothetical protein PRJ_3886 [Pseudomonas sp. XWY-1]|nr:hypothetical protein PRJ_3886 [Pseudomonas sp. XWY-1]